MGEDRLKGPSGGIRAVCGRCGFLRIVTGKGNGVPGLTAEEEDEIASGAAEVFASNAPPGPGDLCPRCYGDAWGLRKFDVRSAKSEVQSR